MLKTVTPHEFNIKKRELKIYGDTIKEDIEKFIAELSSVSELIEALKICANTAGGIEKIKKLSNLNFDTRNLTSILNTIEIHRYMRQ